MFLQNDGKSRDIAALLQTAANPQTPSDVLHDIYRQVGYSFRAEADTGRPENQILAAVAQNPNTPPRLLTLLFNDGYVHAVCQNPAAPLLPLETPTFWLSVRENRLLEMLRLPDVPLPLLSILAAEGEKRPAVREAARLHIGLAGELEPGEWQNVVRDLCQKEMHIRSDDGHKDFKEQLFADWVELNLIPTSWWRPGDLPPPVHPKQPTLGASPGSRPSFLTARDKPAPLPPDATPEFLHDLVSGKEPAERDASVHLAVSLHPNTGPETLRYLGTWRAEKQGLAVALHPNTPPEAWHDFIGGMYEGSDLRHVALAQRPDADAAILRKLASNSRPLIRRLARRHPNAPPDLFGISRETSLSPVKTSEHVRSNIPLWYILYAAHGVPRLEMLAKLANAPGWRLRLATAFALGRRSASETNKDAKQAQKLHAFLQNDGSRLVRAVASAPAAEVVNFTL